MVSTRIYPFLSLADHLPIQGWQRHLVLRPTYRIFLATASLGRQEDQACSPCASLPNPSRCLACGYRLPFSGDPSQGCRRGWPPKYLARGQSGIGTRVHLYHAGIGGRTSGLLVL